MKRTSAPSEPQNEREKRERAPASERARCAHARHPTSASALLGWDGRCARSSRGIRLTRDAGCPERRAGVPGTCAAD